MPELPEVQTIVSSLSVRLTGLTILQVDLRRADILQPDGTDLPSHLRGRRINAITRRAKRIVFRLDNHHQFYIHLGMTGRLTAESPAGVIAPHTHLILTLSDGLQMRFRDPRRFGGIWWLGLDETSDANIGPEPFDLHSSELHKRLQKTRRAIKSALLDQSLIAGLGNIYADEALYCAGIHPLTPANTLDHAQTAKLCRCIKSTLNQALKHKGSTLRDYRDSDGSAGGFQKLHRVYDRAGKPCAKCRTPIVRIVISGRSAHFCPNCQRTK